MCEPKVTQPIDPVGFLQDIRRRYVPVDDPFGMSMLERRAHLHTNIHDLAFGQPTPLAINEYLRKVGSFDVVNY